MQRVEVSAPIWRGSACRCRAALANLRDPG